MAQPETYDVVIIGGGPAGLAAAVYAARSKLKTLVLDKSPAAGALGMASKIESFPGILEATTGLELLSRFRGQAQKFGASIVPGEAIGVDFGTASKQVSALTGDYRGTVIIAATGAMGRKPSIEGESVLIGKGVSYCAACDAAFFEGKDVAAVGDLNPVFEEVEQLARFARTLYVVVSGGEPSEEHRSMLSRHPNAQLIRGFRLARILGTDSVTGVEVADLQGHKRALDVSGVFLYIHGRLPIVDFLKGAVELDGEGCIRVDRTDMSTSVKGVYAIGDVTCRTFRQAVLAAADGCLAALSAERYLSALRR
ncbi:MAG: FAD-dependent oxidoreductase [Chloroflexi bacterium]|nr:FAD-dependent oxidoreductase [Chloroflexota bacterium]